ncbi:LysM repeat protein [Caldicoprobacter guelmensis]|uniref:LysM peptidoglycan-binding domain-containing protein n=1 Tax=Caldicoprobacter guelmensis TaxID=1170224 RepID=UPI001FB0398D|nr:LysM peptidoglycan-binding domain-containing protein [Caldicoprobacter guelmensis]MBM7581542.1 LysM repeat protein [Caldicoprobacter guelmensis]
MEYPMGYFYPLQQCPPGTMPYIIRPGDTFFSLARRFNTTVAAIISANPGIDPNRLQIGQRICIPMQPQFPPCPEGNFYTIRPGDTLFSIARRFNVSVDDILEANPGIDPENLRVGQVICIPLAVPPVTCPAGTFPYVVRAGDTFFSLARRFGTTVAAIMAANPGVDPEGLLVGQTICIPGAAPPVCPAGTTPYIIRAGDTFFNLARRFNTTVEAIIAANPGVDPNRLQIGQRICIPTAAPPVCPAGTTPYIIRSGDTFFNLARRFGTTVEAIIAANPGVDPNRLQIGQRICIPV